MTLKITVNRNGPYVIAPEDVASVTLVDHEGKTIPPRAAAGKPMKLCRCGASPVKPFCDGTHSRIGFVGAEAARAAFDAAPGGGQGAGTAPAAPMSPSPSNTDSPTAAPGDSGTTATDSDSIPQGDGAVKPMPAANDSSDTAR